MKRGRQIYTEKDRQTDRQTDRDKNTHTTHICLQTDRQIHRCTNTMRHIQKNMHTQKDRNTNKYAHTWKDRQTQTHMIVCTCDRYMYLKHTLHTNHWKLTTIIN